MRKNLWTVCAGLAGLAALLAPGNAAQAQEMKEKPPLYTYVANWQFMRGSWGDAEKSLGALDGMMQKAMSDGTIVGYGDDMNLVHQMDAETHDNWWAATSLAGVVKVLNQLHDSSSESSPALNAARHWDEIYVSHYYNWKPGAVKNGYTHVSVYKLKEDAADDTLDNLSGRFIAPVLEKLVADGTISEYEIDDMAIHTEDPGTFLIVYITPTPEGLDKVQAAILDAVKNSPLSTQAFGSVVDGSAHRDGLYRTNCEYK